MGCDRDHCTGDRILRLVYRNQQRPAAAATAAGRSPLPWTPVYTYVLVHGYRRPPVRQQPWSCSHRDPYGGARSTGRSLKTGRAHAPTRRRRGVVGGDAGKRTLSTFRGTVRLSLHSVAASLRVPCVRARDHNVPAPFVPCPRGFADSTRAPTRTHTRAQTYIRTHTARRPARTLSWVEPYGRAVSFRADTVV